MSSQTVLLLVAALIQGSMSQAVCTEASSKICDAQCNIAFCTDVGATPIVVQTCTAGKYCTDTSADPTKPNLACSAAKCSNAFTPHPTTCLQTGVFPSPYDCKKSYFCAGEQQDPTTECTCGDGETYDPATASCSTTATCADAPQCSASGQNGPLGDKSNFCYLCDQDWNANVYRCVKGSQAYMGDIIQELAKKQDCKPYVKPTGNNPVGNDNPPAGNTQTPNVVCRFANERVANSSSCTKYYVCDTLLKPVEKECPTGYKFDATVLSCLKGTCV